MNVPPLISSAQTILAILLAICRVSKMAAHRIDRLGALAGQEISALQHHQSSLAIGRLDRDEARPASSFFARDARAVS